MDDLMAVEATAVTTRGDACKSIEMAFNHAADDAQGGSSTALTHGPVGKGCCTKQFIIIIVITCFSCTAHGLFHGRGSGFCSLPCSSIFAIPLPFQACPLVVCPRRRILAATTFCLPFLGITSTCGISRRRAVDAIRVAVDGAHCARCTAMQICLVLQVLCRLLLLVDLLARLDNDQLAMLVADKAGAVDHDLFLLLLLSIPMRTPSRAALLVKECQVGRPLASSAPELGSAAVLHWIRHHWCSPWYK
eukprot:scaffold101815_cov30-Tisochrysis_lutea.AAC.1